MLHGDGERVLWEADVKKTLMFASAGFVFLSCSSADPGDNAGAAAGIPGGDVDGGAEANATSGEAGPAGERYADGLFRPDSLAVKSIHRKDVTRPPEIRIADSTHAAALPLGDGLPLKGGGAFKANPTSGGNLFFR